MSYWKTKVLPKIKKFLDKGNKKAAGVFNKKFATEKDAFGKDIDEKKDEFQPKVVEIYRNSPPETQAVLKTPTEESLKANPDAVQLLLVELGKSGIPGAQIVGEATAKIGVGNLPEPVLFLLGKLSVFVVDEPAPVLPPAPEAAPETVEVASKEIEVTPAAETSAETSSATENETPASVPEEKKSEPETVAAAPPVSAPDAAPAAAAPVTPPPAAPITTPAPEVAATPPAATTATPAPTTKAPAPSS